jgi:hypothetical protein
MIGLACAIWTATKSDPGDVTVFKRHADVAKQLIELYLLKFFGVVLVNASSLAPRRSAHDLSKLMVCPPIRGGIDAEGKRRTARRVSLFLRAQKIISEGN